MKIEWAEATGSDVGQFIVQAEDAAEREILRRFVSEHSKYHLWLHGYCEYSREGPGVCNFNFGYNPRVLRTLQKGGK